MDDLDAVLLGARLLFQNGQTTERTATTAMRLGAALGHRTTLFPHWGELSIRVDGPSGCRQKTIDATPAGVDMNKVVATTKVIDDICDGRIDAAQARASFEAIARYPPVGLIRFSSM